MSQVEPLAQRQPGPQRPELDARHQPGPQRPALDARKRTVRGKGPVKRMRKEGWAPAILYSHGKESELLAIETRKIEKALDSGAHVVAIGVSDSESDAPPAGKAPDHPILALIREVQFHPVSQELLHIDFQEVAAHDLIEISVPLSFRGEPAGVKEGGVLDVLLREIAVRCPAETVVDDLRVDVTELELGHSLRVREIALPEGAEAATPANQVVAVVRRPREEVEEEVAAAGTEVAEQPEVIGEKEREEREPPDGETREKGKPEKGGRG